MNEVAPTHLNLEYLESIAVSTADQRRVQRETMFFYYSLHIVPQQLLADCRLVGVDHITNEYNGAVRIRSCETEFDVSFDHVARARVFHAALPLTPALWELEDYSVERASALERSLRRRSLLNALLALALLIPTAVMAVMLTRFPNDPRYLVALSVGGIVTASVIALNLSDWPARGWRLIFPKRLRTPDDITLQAFEQWRTRFQPRGES